MSQAESIMIWSAIFLFLASFCLLLFGYVGRREGLKRGAVPLAWAGLAALTVAVLLRWVESGHPPVTDSYELNLIGTWFTILLFLVFEKLGKAEKSFGLLVLPVVFLVLGFAAVARTEVTPMGPAFQSPWLIVHVIFAWLAFGSYAVATGAALLLLIKHYRPRGNVAHRTPDPEVLDLSAYRFIILGFINHAIMLISGAIWAKKLWGHYWSWDALETWSLIAFLFYALYLHVRSFFGWKMARAAWLTIAGLIILIISFWGVSWFSPTVHPGP
jgi:cytochrome c-type biogenesis protein CcsB